MSVVPASSLSSICPNCHTALASADLYCRHCGQLARSRALTVREFVRDYGRQYLGPEGVLWRTLALLLVRPGRLTQAFLAG